MKGLYCDNYDCKNFGVNLLEKQVKQNNCCKRVINLYELTTNWLKPFEKTAVLMAHHLKYRKNGIKPVNDNLMAVHLENGLMTKQGERYHLTNDGRFIASWLIENDSQAAACYYGIR